MKRRLEKLWGKSKNEVLELMKGEVELFNNISSFEKKRIAHFFYKRSFKMDEVVFKEGSLSNVLYVVMGGEALAMHLGKNTAEGEVISTFSKGDKILLSSIITPFNRPYSLAAKSDLISLVLFTHDLEELLELYPKIGVKLLYNISVLLSSQLNMAYAKNIKEDLN